MQRAPTFSFIFFNDSIFERLQEEELKQLQEQEQQQPQHLKVKVEWRQEQERPNNSSSVVAPSSLTSVSRHKSLILSFRRCHDLEFQVHSILTRYNRKISPLPPLLSARA